MKKTLQLDMDPTSEKRLRWVAQHLVKAPRDVTQAVRRALHLYELALKNYEDGGTLFIRRKDGSEAELEIV